MTSICSVCSTGENLVEFNTVKELSDHIKGGHKSGKKPAVEPVVIKQEPAKPIELRYKFEGQCPKCNKEIDTITVDLGESEQQIAYCTNCRLQHKQIRVIPISKQFKTK